jgi:hypothetical protein
MINDEDEEEFEKQKRDDYLRDLDEEDYYGQNPFADLDYWSRAAYWTVEEATALSFGREPRIVNSDSIPSPGPFSIEYEKRRDLALRAKEMEKLKEKNPPLDYINWAKQSGIPFSEELETLVLERQGPVLKKLETLVQERQGPDRKTRPKSAEKKVTDSLLKMVLGMAAAYYGYDSKKLRSHGPPEVKEELDRVGIKMDLDTVRKWLQRAAEEHGDLLRSKDETSG